jgi:endonuclease/exonuclease/phosphatase (EEP) superfamily protein YafD
VKGIRIALGALAAIPLTASLLHAAASYGMFPSGSPLAGASYLPPSWLGALVVPIALACWIARARKVSFALVASYALGVLPHADFSLRTGARKSDLSGGNLSVVALNVQYYSFGAEKVAQAIKKLGADVALLSENVLDAAEAEVVQRELYPSSFRMGKSGETAIASKHRILEFKEVELPTFQASLTGPSRLDQSQAGVHRSFSHAVIEVDGTPVNLISVRLIAGRAPASDPLSQISWGLYLMRSQNAEVEFLKSYLAQLKGPFVIGGDLNAPPSAPVVRALRELASDAYLATHHLGKATFRVRAPLLRIDYLFASTELVPVDSRRVDVEVSDHFPVFAEFQLPRQRARAPIRSSGEPSGL